MTTSGARCFGTPRKRSNGSSLPSSRTATLARRVERGRRGGPGRTRCPARRTRRASAADVSGDGGTGVAERDHERDLAARRGRRAPRGSRASSSAHSLGAGGHLNGAPHTPTIARPSENGAAPRRSRVGAGDGVELVAALGEPRRRVEVVVGAERDDEDVGLVEAGVGRHAPRLRVDRGDRLLQEAHAGLRDVAVREADRVGRRPPEHHVELRVAEDERVALVDQRHVDVVAERLRQRSSRARDRRSPLRVRRSWRSPRRIIEPSPARCLSSSARRKERRLQRCTGMTRERSKGQPAFTARLAAGGALALLIGAMTAHHRDSGRRGRRTRQRVTATTTVTAVTKRKPAPPKTRRVVVTAVGAYDPEGDRSENDGDAALAADGNTAPPGRASATADRSRRPASASSSTPASRHCDTGRGGHRHPGLQGRGPRRRHADGAVLAGIAGDSRPPRERSFALRPTRGRYLMLWIMSMPASGAAAVNEITVAGCAGDDVASRRDRRCRRSLHRAPGADRARSTGGAYRLDRRGDHLAACRARGDSLAWLVPTPTRRWSRMVRRSLRPSVAIRCAGGNRARGDELGRPGRRQPRARRVDSRR